MRRHIARVPGRKTDVQDCVWIAQLVEHGLVRGSFVPPAPIRDLRDLTRARKALSQDRTRAANRLHKVLEDAGIKLASVANDVLGVSGRAMLEALASPATRSSIWSIERLLWRDDVGARRSILGATLLDGLTGPSAGCRRLLRQFICGLAVPERSAVCERATWREDTPISIRRGGPSRPMTILSCEPPR